MASRRSSPSSFLPAPAERRRLLAGLSQPPEAAARFLLGHMLVRQSGRQRLSSRIVETEAYLGERDPAAHAFHGRTARTEPLWGPPGTLYIYLVYGMHYCLNLAVEREGVPGCVLIRAVEPLDTLDPRACQGPGRLCRALSLNARLSGRWLFDPEVGLTLREGRPPSRIGVSPRIGIGQAAGWPLRFFDADTPAVSGRRAPRRP